MGIENTIGTEGTVVAPAEMGKMGEVGRHFGRVRLVVTEGTVDLVALAEKGKTRKTGGCFVCVKLVVTEEMSASADFLTSVVQTD